MEKQDIKALIEQAKAKSLRIVTAESLTCGMIGSTLASIAGASAVINGGFLVYQDRMKEKQLGVPPSLLKDFTAVSSEVAEAMAKGALEQTNEECLGDEASDISIAVTGYAGSPGGLAAEALSGLVYIALGYRSPLTAYAPQIKVFPHQFPGDRQAVRDATVDKALMYTQQLIQEIA